MKVWEDLRIKRGMKTQLAERARASPKAKNRSAGNSVSARPRRWSGSERRRRYPAI